MFKCLSLFLFSTSVAFASTHLLEKHAMSGLVPADHQFKKDCMLNENGNLESITVKGDGTSLGFANIVPKWKMVMINRLLRQAKRGRIEETPMPCDGGSQIFKGSLKGELVELDIAMDCGMRRRNKSMATPALEKIATDLCGF